MEKSKKSSKRVLSAQQVLSERNFSKQQRCQIIEEYLSGTASRAQVWEKYTGRDQEHGCLLRWMRQLGYLTKTGKDQTGKERRRKRIILLTGNFHHKSSSSMGSSSMGSSSMTTASTLRPSLTPLADHSMSSTDLDAHKNADKNPGVGSTITESTTAGSTTIESSTDKEALLAQIQQLKTALQQAQLKAEGYELMIQLAEKQFQIPIRKKSDTK